VPRQEPHFGLLTRWALRISLERLRAADAMEMLARRGVVQTWRRSIAEALAVIDLLDARITPLHEKLRPFAAADPRVLPLRTIPGIGELLGLTHRGRNRRRCPLWLTAQADPVTPAWPRASTSPASVRAPARYRLGVPSAHRRSCR
jgi:hypothetical protein